MKSILTLLVAFLLCLTRGPVLPNSHTVAPVGNGVRISETNFPDDSFRDYVDDYCDLNSDGALSDWECANVTYIDVEGKGISDLTGIGYFTELETLYCSDNQLRELDVSANTSLVYLYCAQNQLTTLDLSANMSLEKLICYENALTNIKVGNNPMLRVLNSRDNGLTALDIRACPHLIDAYANGELENESGHMRYEVASNEYLLYVDSSVAIHAEPIITAQPESQSAKEDTSVEFTVEAVGEGLTYQWYYRMSESDTWKKSTLNGNDTATLSVKATETRNGYQYKCKVSNDAAYTYTDVATLTVTK